MIPAAIGGGSLASFRIAALPSDTGGSWSPEGVTERIRATEKSAAAIHERYSDELLGRLGPEDVCPCGRTGQTISVVGRLPRAEPGCCAVTIDRFMVEKEMCRR